MEEYIGGKHSVLEALRSERTIHKIWITETMNKQMIHALLDEAKQRGVLVQTMDKRKMDQLVEGVSHQGVIAQVAAYSYVEVEDLLNRAAELQQDPFLCILDEIEDPHNLGSILRTAECTGVHGIIIPKRRSAGLTASVSKISAGAIEYIPVARVTNLAQTIDQLKAKGIWIAGTDASAKQTIFQASFSMPIALVIGNEGKGLGRLVKEKCDFLLQLPMVGHIHSLNASVAAGVTMYEVFRQRQSS
jgi:23S rRNA (guanosine2251-2'-O)-methyltransferase